MAIELAIFDVDGTLVDSNDLHALAWLSAIEARGHHAAYETVRAHIGMGGDKLVPSILGEEVEEREGDALRELQDRYFEELMADESRPKRAFPGVLELFSALRQRGLKIALATSGEREKLELVQRAFAIDLTANVDETVTASAVEESKPAPDLVCAALAQTRVKAKRAVMVGDTPYDANACRSAGVACIGVRSGGWSDTLLRAAGAVVTYADAGDLLDHLDDALAIAQRGQ